MLHLRNDNLEAFLGLRGHTEMSASCGPAIAAASNTPSEAVVSVAALSFGRGWAAAVKREGSGGAVSRSRVLRLTSCVGLRGLKRFEPPAGRGYRPARSVRLLSGACERGGSYPGHARRSLNGSTPLSSFRRI